MQLRSGWLRGALVGLALAATLSIAKAQAPAPDERMTLAAEMAALLGPAEFGMYTEPLAELQWEGIDAQLPPGADAALRAELRDQFVVAMAQIYLDAMHELLAEILPDYTLMIADVFSVEEMRAWLAFYDTPAGTKVFEVQVQVLSAVASMAGDPNTAAGAALAGMNEVLRRYGLQEYQVPDLDPAVAPPQAPVLSEAAIRARALVPIPPETLGELGRDIAMDTAVALWLQVEPTLPANAELRDALYQSLVSSLVGYHQSLAEPLIDEMAAMIAVALTPDELDTALAFYATPEAANWVAQYRALDEMMEERAADTIAPMLIAMSQQVAALIADLNAVLAQRGLPPVRF